MFIKKDMSDEELNAFISYIEKAEMLNAPKNLKEQILMKRNQEKEKESPRCEIGESRDEIAQESKRVQSHHSGIKESGQKAISAKFQFFTYSLKISVAVAAAIVLLFCINTDTVPAFPRLHIGDLSISERNIVGILNEKSNEWSGMLNQFSSILY